MSFETLLCEPNIKKAIAELGYKIPTDVQQEAIPEVHLGKDLLVSAETGTGKTAAFLLPAIQKIMKNSERKGKGPYLLVLVPTRELALQVTKEAEKFCKYLKKFKTVCIYGGVPYPVQKRQLSKPYEILVATPGRLLDHMNAERVDFSQLEMLVLDEADRMLDMGFIDSVKEIASKTPKKRQTLLFSATLKGNIQKLASVLLKDPVTITVQASHANFDRIEQKLYFADSLDHKYQLLESILTDSTLSQAVVFTSTKALADTIATNLQEIGHKALSLHGDMCQRKRTKTLNFLRDGKIAILVATDVAARGIDIQSITHVVNFDLPMQVEDYVHRIGRTGRKGASGKALSLVSARDQQQVKKIESYTGSAVAVCQIAGLEPKTQCKNPKPKKQIGNRRFKNERFSGNRRRKKSFSRGM